jgi:hypothetical protein
MLTSCHNISHQLRQQIREVLEDELSVDPPTAPDLRERLAAIVTQWHREMSKRFHPDVGGDPVVMAAINHGVDRLRELLEI